MTLALLLDPRTIDTAASIAENMGQVSPHPEAHIDKMVMAARAKLSKAHCDINKKMQEPREEASPSPDQCPSNDVVAH
ncbi:hypothetical protein PI125_g5979 [Phytophthora idaei]|nr:hypothetical protein PI125_g5979 [Phytophthora idaei]